MAKNLNTKHVLYGVVVCVIIYALYKSHKSGGGGAASGDDGAGADFTVYGTEWCGYTTKQRDALSGRHVYIDCDMDKDKCQGINSFPVTVNNVTGEKHKGFKPNL